MVGDSLEVADEPSLVDAVLDEDDAALCDGEAETVAMLEDGLLEPPPVHELMMAPKTAKSRKMLKQPKHPFLGVTPLPGLPPGAFPEPFAEPYPPSGLWPAGEAPPKPCGAFLFFFDNSFFTSELVALETMAPCAMTDDPIHA